MSEIGSDGARLRSQYKHLIEMDEILINILTKLPVKNAVACKCVSKHWLRLISEPSFPRLQMSWSSKNPKYIICPYVQDNDIITHFCSMDENGKITEDILLDGFETVCSPEFVCFLNGLICCVYEDCSTLNEVDIRIFNPVTRDSVVLPRGSLSTEVPSVGIAFDAKSNDFKAFRFFSVSTAGDIFKCEVFASGSTAWRMISDNVQRPEHSPFHSVYCPYYASVAGAIYWFVWSQDDPGTPVGILSVDMKDKFMKIKLPTQLYHWSFLVEIEGCLSVVHVNNPLLNVLGEQEDPDPQPYVEIYKWENSRWNLRSKATMDLINIHSFNSVAARDNDIFFIMRLEDESLCYLIFDFVQKTFKTLDLDENFFEDYSPVAFSFAESLLKCSGT